MMRVLSILLCVVLLVPSMAPRAKAVDLATVVAFFEDVAQKYAVLEGFLEVTGKVLNINYDQLSTPMDIEELEWTAGTAWTASKNLRLEISDNDILGSLILELNNTYRDTGLSFSRVPISNASLGVSYWAIACVGSSSKGGGTQTFFLCDGSGSGRVLCCPIVDVSSDFSDIWMPKEYMGDRLYLMSYDDFYNKVFDNAGAGCTPKDHIFTYQNGDGKYYCAQTIDHEYVLARSDGRVYACRINTESTAANQNRPATGTTDNSDQDITIEEGANVGIDIEDATVTLPDGSVLEMISNTYDESTKTYYVDARQYIEEGDTYIYNTYQYTYYINYTSITYIGQTEEYNKYYEVYYELPDGRSSADLTKEDLEQLNVSVDVIPYGRSADDTSLRSLYHFDGDTKDSSYWNYCTDFTWNKGASLTYMDAGVFDGALYLDETEHDFTITLPSAIGTGDFTLQFRYYQSHTEAPVDDSWFSVGNSSKSACFNGAALLDGAGGHIVDIPIGTWNEIALIRHDAQYYFYLNGLMCLSGSWPTVLGNQIQFHFGNQQQTFKYLDELRVLNYALVEDGASYEPTSVPHDTNLTLVLPDSQMPVADEYWYFDTTIEPVLNWDFTGYNGAPYTGFSQTGVSGSPTSMPVEHWSYWSGNTNLVQYDGFCSVSWNGTETVCFPASPLPNGGTFSYYCYAGGIAVPVYNPYWTSNRSGWGYLPPYGFSQDYSLVGSSSCYGKTYTLSLVDVDGKISSFTFSLPTGYIQNSYTLLGSASFDWGSMQLRSGYVYNEDGWNGYPLMLYIRPNVGTTLSFVYAELVEGSTPNTGHEFRSSVTAIDKEDLNTPTLAVRTDLQITNYQIGGPRPSVPTKGLVWALVENGIITSLQIYNGSAWEGVDGRIWTGERWVPMSSYNIITLQDLYDIVDATTDFEYIYTESGFWAWWQRSWNAFVEKLFKILGSGGGGSEPVSDCEHVYSSKVTREPGCAQPGLKTYTCDKCDHAYTETIDATGHDWLVVDTVPDVLDEEGNILEEGYDVLECSVCGAESKDFGDGPVEEDLFDALGNFIADGITWILDKLTELSDSLRTITDTFVDFTTRVGDLAGGFPLFFGAFVALIPEDLQTIMWFAVIAMVVIAVWKKWSK